MAFLKFGKKKKEDLLGQFGAQTQAESTITSPVNQVLMMKQQGYTNNQIALMLQNQGFNIDQINDAINIAGLSGNPAADEQPEMGMPDYGQAMPQPQMQQPVYQQQTQGTEGLLDEERIQEVTEAIIEEKWGEFASDIRKVIEWKERSEDRIAKIEQQILDVRLGIESLTKSILGKISSYDQNITDVGTEIKAMEKVFQKVLPTLTENVNKLDRMAKGYKEPAQKK